MNVQFTNLNKHRLTQRLNRETVLGNWIAAINVFEQHYNHLNRYVPTNYRLASETNSRGQCSIHQLLKMLAQMQEGLEILLVDLDELKHPEQLSSQCTLKKLAAHTVTLEQLNHKAQTLRQVVSLSAS